jgi:hypothetical protein
MSGPARNLAGGSVRYAVGACLLFCALTWWLLDFRAGYAGTRLPSDLGDPVLVSYFLEWGGHSLRRGLRGYLDFWDANFYFPEKAVMTLSDHLLGPALQVGAFEALWDNEVAGYNFLFLGSFALSGLIATWVLRQAGISRTAAILGGIMFAFSPYRFDQRAHLQVLLAQWIPLVLWLWHRLLAQPTARRALPFLAAYLVHVTGGMYLAYFVHFALALLLLAHRDRWRELIAPRALRVLVPTGVACVAVAAAIFVPYAIASERMGLGRGLADFGFFSATVLSYFAVDHGNALWGEVLRPFARPENQLFAGLVATLLCGVGIARSWTRPRVPLYRAGSQPVRRIDPDRPVYVLSQRRWIILGALFFLVLCGFLVGDVTTLTRAQEIPPGTVPQWMVGYLAPALLIYGCGAAWLLLWRRWRGEWPLRPPSASRWERGLLWIGLFFVLLSFAVVFAPLARVVPGLDGLRVPTRVYPFISFPLVYFAARGLDWLLARAQGRRRRLVLAGVAGFLLLELRDDMDWHRWPSRERVPAIFHRIAEVPDVGAVLHLPMARVPFEAHYMYYSIAHWRPIANGYSGYEPERYLELKRRVNDGLFEESTLDYMIELGITHVAVHPWLFRMPAERRRLLRWERQFGIGEGARLRSVLLVERDRLYEILPPPGNAARTSAVQGNQ